MSGRTTAFFYGLFMDDDLLRSMGAAPRHLGIATVAGYRLHIAARATLVTASAATVEGVLAELDDAELARLYEGPSVSDYVPIEVRARLADGMPVRAACYVLPAAAATGPRNEDYAAKLRELAGRLGLSPEYVATI